MEFWVRKDTGRNKKKKSHRSYYACCYMCMPKIIDDSESLPHRLHTREVTEKKKNTDGLLAPYNLDADTAQHFR